jgi:hypothetical protein
MPVLMPALLPVLTVLMLVLVLVLMLVPVLVLMLVPVESKRRTCRSAGKFCSSKSSEKPPTTRARSRMRSLLPWGLTRYHFS